MVKSMSESWEDPVPEYEQDPERRFLLLELQEAHKMNRDLLRQLKKSQRVAEEAIRAHAKMVETLTRTMRENMLLMDERDCWKHRAQQWSEKFAAKNSAGAQSGAETVFPGIGHITAAEARVIRKAIARLHHPDSGGDTKRMQEWNALLDRIERQQR